MSRAIIFLKPYRGQVRIPEGLDYVRSGRFVAEAKYACVWWAPRWNIPSRRTAVYVPCWVFDLLVAARFLVLYHLPK